MIRPRRRVRCPTGREEGAILILALLVLVLLAGALALAVASVQERQRAVVREGEQIQLMALSDAAIAETLARLAKSRGFSGIGEKEFGPGSISSQVTTDGENSRMIRVRVVYRERERQVEVRAQLTAGGPRVTDFHIVQPAGGASAKQ